MGKKQTPQTNKRYTAEYKSEAIKLAERRNLAEAAIPAKFTTGSVHNQIACGGSGNSIMSDSTATQHRCRASTQYSMFHEAVLPSPASQ